MRKFRFCVPVLQGRGAGLGNELVPWAKAFIASQELGLRLLHPAWGLNPRGYGYYFGTSRFDWVWQRALMAALPVVTFTEGDYRRYGHDHFGPAIRAFSEENRLSERGAYVLRIEGMWGGYLSISDARDFVRGELHSTRNCAENLYDLRRRLPKDNLVVAVHIRRGDFLASATAIDFRGRFNVSLPLEWYVNVCRNLTASLGEHVTFLLLTDGTPKEVGSFVDEFSPVTTFHQTDTAITDLLALAEADLLVCSVSSYSMWAAFLSEKPYLWYAPNLQQEKGFFSLWGHEPAQCLADGATTRNIRHLSCSDGKMLSRGVPTDETGQLSATMLKHLQIAWEMKQKSSDLVSYGVVSAGGECARSQGCEQCL